MCIKKAIKFCGLHKMILWVFGVGLIGQEYYKIVSELGWKCVVFGRGKISSKLFEEKFGLSVVTDSATSAVQDNKFSVPENAIICCNIDQQLNLVRQLIDLGIKNILVEKPLTDDLDGLVELEKYCNEKKTRIFVGYNRRFYNSVIECKKLIAEDGGITSFHFDFTEWSDVIDKSHHNALIKSKWLINNSSHLIDLAFYLGGNPKVLKPMISGGLEWHKRGSIFKGIGVTINDSLFSYSADWSSAGRWELSLCTARRKFILSPLESLKYINKNEVTINNIVSENQDDIKYKPGFMKQVKNFLNGDHKDLCCLSDQVRNMHIYYKIAGY